MKAAVTAAAAIVGGCAAADPTIKIPGVGTVAGAAVDGGRSFKGIPYATPPLRDLRWQPPTPHASWEGVRAAKDFGNACLGAGGGVKEDEDCLFLNVYAPAEVPSTPIPVMVWIHGGAYTSGCSNIYPGAAIVAASNQSVIVVSVNYRLNVFGFTGSALLSTADGGTGNYGIQDQRASLQWVKDHIAAFGGDAGNVLIFGESAGGNSMVNHLTQEKSFGLYHKVVVESGTYHGVQTLDSAEKGFASLTTALACTQRSSMAACARAADASKVRAGMSGSWGPVIDGVNLLGNPQDLIAQGKHNTKVPVVLGSNRDETSMFTNSTGVFKVAKLEFQAAMAVAAPGKGAQAVKIYDPANYDYPEDLGPYNVWWWASMRASTDADISLGPCSVRRTARGLAAHNPNVWTYLFAHPLQVPVFPPAGPGNVLVPHASEIMFVYNCACTSAPRRGAGGARRLQQLPTGDCAMCADPATDGGAERALGAAVSNYWIRFAQTGDPNGAGAVAWPKFTAAGDELLRLDAPPAGIAVQTGARKDACDFWDTVAK